MKKRYTYLPEARKIQLAKGLLGLLWFGIITACLLHRDAFILERILTAAPRRPVLTAAALLILFAVKSLSVFLYCGFLYAASGILYPLPIAILLSVAGSAIMSSIPYWLGKKLGGRVACRLRKRYPQMTYLHDLRRGNDFLFVLIVRLLGVLPADVVSAYMGAAGVRYRVYLPACVLGLLPTCILFPIMGMSISDVRSPQFLVSAGVGLAAMLLSCAIFHIYRKKRCSSKQQGGKQQE